MPATSSITPGSFISTAFLKKRQQSLGTNKADAKASRELFLLLAYRGRFDESLTLGERLTAESPQDLPLALDYARVLSWSKQREKSIDQYNRLMAKSPDNPFLMLELRPDQL